MSPFLISSKLRRKLLAHFFAHPDEQYYVREIAVLLDLDPGNLSKELRKLTREGLFLEKQKGRIKFYRLNRDCPLYPELKQILFKTEGVEGQLRSLVSRFSAIQIAFLYGSYARGEEKSTSDVDLIVVGDVDRKTFTSEILNLENKLGREIHFNLYPQSEFDRKSKEQGSFLAQVASGKKIMLKGQL